MRVPMVTRTITHTTVSAKVYAKAENKLVDKSYTLPRTYKDVREIEKYFAKHIDSEDEKLVSVMSWEEHEDLYGMREEEFIKYAHIIKKEKEN